MELADKIARDIFRKINPGLGKIRKMKGEGIHDVLFEMDEIAERVVEERIKDRKTAYFSEDRGLVKKSEAPDHILIIDPIDGTRPAKYGLEPCVTSIAVCKYSENPRFKDIEYAIVKELKTGDELKVKRGEGLKAELTGTEDFPEMGWSFEVCGFSPEKIVKKLGPLIDASSKTGGVFVWSSSAYSITRIVTGQLDAFVDVRGLIDPKCFCLQPYDIAGAYLILKEAGGVITDCRGNGLDDLPLMGGSLSCVAASNQILHRKILETLK